jgi:tRNA pseudouridine38-40 synthase
LVSTLLVPTYRLDLAYDGTGFHGYASQPGLRTVQGELEKALQRQVGDVVTVVAGRTDRGVHASGQVVCFSHAGQIDAEGVMRSLNSQLGDEIAVLDLQEVDNDFHARFSAIARAYRYEILNRPVRDPLRSRTTWHVREPLDVEAMNEAAGLLIGSRDFASFCRKREDRSTEREVMWAGWRRLDDIVELSIAAEAFCHQMVRSIVIVLVDVGRGRIGTSDVKTILAAEDRRQGHGVAPPQGLNLVRVGYPGEPFDPPEWITETL